jgi:hypothetical protein
VQLRYKTGLTSSEYVTREAWRDATLARCPRHPQGGCRFARHGTYARVSPPGTRIARWYCPQAQQTFSLLPDCLAARWSGTLVEIEAAVDHSEAASSLQAATVDYRLEVELAGVLRWLHRRRQAVATILVLVRGLLPSHFLNVAPTLAAFRTHLGLVWVLWALRELAAEHLPSLPPPLGFRPPVAGGGEPSKRRQHRAGADPPQRAP